MNGNWTVSLDAPFPLSKTVNHIHLQITILSVYYQLTQYRIPEFDIYTYFFQNALSVSIMKNVDVSS